jgi:Tat protein translocase TatB subunit
MGNFGFGELIMIFAVALVVFGPRKLPEIGRTIGAALREFRRATNDLKNTLDEEVRVDEVKKSLSAVRETASQMVGVPDTVTRDASPRRSAPAAADSVAAEPKTAVPTE